MAESYFNIKDHVQAGLTYEKVVQFYRRSRRLKNYYDSALQSFITALKEPEKLSLLEIHQTRTGLRSLGSQFVSLYPRDKATPNIYFLIGRTYYDERSFDLAVKHLLIFIQRYPRHSQTALSVDLILDSYNQREDYKGLAKAGRRILQVKSLRPSVKQTVKAVVQQAQYRNIQQKAGKVSSPLYTQQLLKFAAKYKGSDLGDKALYEAFVNLKKKKDPRAYVPGEQLLLKYGNSKYAKEVVSEMGKMALLTADFRRAARYFEGFQARYPKEPEATNLLKQAAQMREFMGDFNLAATNYRKLRDYQSIARAHYLSQQWRKLSASAIQVPGVRGAYWRGLAQYRLGNYSGASAHLREASRSRGRTDEEKAMIGHASYLRAMRYLRYYKTVQMRLGKEKEAIDKKDNMLNQLTKELNKVIALGNGRWTIASLYTMGLANQEFADFLKKAPAPPNLTRALIAQYKAELNKRARVYERTALGLYGKCLQSGAKFEVFTRFIEGCKSKGRVLINEAEETTVRLKAASEPPLAAENIRKRLYNDPRNTKLLLQLAQTYSRGQDYSMALLILNRALEIQKNNSNAIALQGVNWIFMNDYEQAKYYLKKSLSRNSRNSTALWNLASLYKKFEYQNRFKQLRARAQRSGKPIPPYPDLLQQIQ